MEYISYDNKKIKEQARKINNQKYIKEELENNNDYFNNMFKTVDKNIILDNEQRKIIVNDEKYQMVIAGAGSGKTTTISAKVNYLIDKKKIKDDEILVISFTNKAVEELNKRINIDFNHKVKVTTFHKFGYEIIKSNMEHKPKIETKPQVIIKKYIETTLIKNTKELKKFLDLYISYFNISEEIYLFNNYDNYYKYKNKLKYSTIKSKIEYIKTETDNLNVIAKYLYINDIKYEYEKPYIYNKKYKPTFTISYKNKIYYIEYFNVHQKNKFKYQQSIKNIIKIHKKHNTHLIEIYNDNIIEKLMENINPNPQKIEQIFKTITLNKKDNNYQRFIDFCLTYINLFKSKGYQVNDFDKLKPKNKREQIFIEFIKNVYIYYQNELKKNNTIDFEDIINVSCNIVNKKAVSIKYKYIIIDEYQDISMCRYKLIKNITDKNDNKLIVVGDDWQSIFAFASSNINLFTNFKKNVPYCEIMKIQTTYRNSQELIDIASKFILKNNKQIYKKLISFKNLKNPLIILKYKNEIAKKLIESLEYLITKYGENKNILILTRYTFDIKTIRNNENIILENNKVIYKKYPKVNIEYMTIHSAKGLGYDNVILLNAKSDVMGFPSKIRVDPILKNLITEDKTIKYAEERRLFYVALTRTKNEIIILAPNDKMSTFVKEIKKYKNVIEKSNIKYK